MFKKWTALALVSVMVFVVSACGGTKSGTETTSPSAAASTDAPKATEKAPTEKTVIKMIGWKQEAQNVWMTEFNKKFEAAYPQYKVDYTVSLPDDVFKQLQTTRLTANDVDLVPHLSSFIRGPKDFTPGADKPTWMDWIDSGLLLDISDQAFVKNYNANDIASATTYNGKVYGVPTGTVAFSGLFYNKDIFAKYNLKVPTTWTELQAVFKTLKENKVTPIGLAGKDKWPINLATMGLQATVIDDQQKFVEGLWKGTSKFTDKEPVEVLTKIKVLMDNAEENFMGVDYGSLPALFTSGKVAMVADGSWDAPVYEKAGLKFGYFPIPGNEDAAKNANLTGKYDLTFTIAAKGPNTAGALKWLEEFSKPENYASWVTAAGFLPTQDVKVDSPFISEIQQYLKGFKLGYEQVMIGKPNEGEHITNANVHAEFLAPGGPFKKAEDLAVVQQKEWEAAK